MSSTILLTYDRNPLRAYAPESFVKKLISLLRGRAVSAWIFGSFNTPRFSHRSDVDIFIVTETDVPFIERPLLLDDLLDLFPALDILVYTPREFEKLTSDPSPGFWKSAVAEMKQIL